MNNAKVTLKQERFEKELYFFRKILVRTTRLRHALFTVFTCVPFNVAFRFNKINLSDSDIWIDADRVNNSNFQSPGRVVTNNIIAIFFKTPANISKTSCDMSVYPKTPNGTSAFKHRDITMTYSSFICHSDVEFARFKYKAFFWDNNLFCWIWLFQ